MEARKYRSATEAEAESAFGEGWSYYKQRIQAIDPDLLPLRDAKGGWHMEGMISSSVRENCRMGNVNIGNRIFTDDMVTMLGNGKYRITPAADFFKLNFTPTQLLFLISAGNQTSTDTKVKATIDGIEYVGDVILVDKKDVYVNDQKITCLQEEQPKTLSPKI